MKCIKCTSENINKANYCFHCGYEFNEDERRHARRHTLVGKLELIEKAYNVCTLNVITGHILFKILSLIVVLLFCFYFVFYNGNKVKLLNSDKYNIEYNTTTNEYYLLGSEDTINLNLYVPNNTKSLSVKHYDKDNNLIEELDCLKESIILNVNYKDDYYILSEEDNVIKFFVYRTEV